MPTPRSFSALLALAAALWTALAAPALASSRIKDIVTFEGVRENQLVGYGLVVGLAGTGDTLRNTAFTQQSLQAMLERLGVQTRGLNLDTKNVAAVVVTARLPPFSTAGSKIDVSVSAMGDAKSLLGGTLMVTPLMGADGEAYAVAQGTVQTGAISAQGQSGSSVTRGVPTAGKIANGAEVEREIAFKLADQGEMRLTLRNPDFTTARRLAETINALHPGVARVDNPAIVTLTPPKDIDIVSFVTGVEALEVEPDAPAKVVVDEVNGVIVLGSDVRISTVAIAQGNLTISVDERPQVSQPTPESNGQTAITPKTSIKVDEAKGKKFLTVHGGTSLTTLVKGLNALGVTPRDMISILQAIKAEGALQADIQVM